ncbi:MAG: hypothetical protein AB7L09_03405 [Nitrospira sp.]
MNGNQITIKAKLPSMRDRNGNFYPPEAYIGAVAQMNDLAQQGRLVGCIEASGDGKTRLDSVSHKILPDASINKDGTISVTIEVVDTPIGATLLALLQHSPHRVITSCRGILKGYGSSPEDMKVTGVDFDFKFPKDWTVLDGIVDAMDAND